MASVISFSRYRTRNAHPYRKKNIFAEFDFNSLYQPIFSPTHQKLVGFEALVRVNRDHQPVSPVELFENARSSKQTVELDNFLLHRHLRRFAEHSIPSWLFLNINPETCTHPASSLDRLIEQCNACGVSADKVVLELVETASENPGALLKFIDIAKARGFRIAIDDFGTGDSNFERLWQMDPMIVKLDRSLLVNAEQHHRARQLLESLVRMIRESGSLVLLEGIENQAQARIALATEADLLQGFLLGMPDVINQDKVAQGEAALKLVMNQSVQFSINESSDHEGFLRLLRFEILEACHRLARGERFTAACETTLEIEGVKRCFLLNRDGVQQGNLVCSTHDTAPHNFNPLYQSAGACWAHREYFRNALTRPQLLNASRPYVALPDAVRTVTLSTSLTIGNDRKVFCVDLHPDELFDGQLCFPQTL
ncbi:EAL domain-containing protein [Marinobacter sp. ATCH36]|uniref:EAL domain-containing protein n=1 Tax=Marinobacter sp. ATCH36 TaxID=2945106 RepID=UPI00202174F5|nr:EAL domain-containing protein [Marinobacter sp. ATCH36]MCL7942747.1 EAL domain-containing protein [Marinobacter sp. ATCH36]